MSPCDAGVEEAAKDEGEPTLSLVLDTRAPPKVCWPTTAPVPLWLMYIISDEWWMVVLLKGVLARRAEDRACERILRHRVD